MNIAKIVVFVIAFCTFLFATDSTNVQSKPVFKMTNGTLVDVDTVLKTVIVNQGSASDTISFGTKTVFSRYSTPINKTELKAGDNVTVHYRELSGNKTASRVVVRDKQTSATIATQDSSSSQ